MMPILVFLLMLALSACSSVPGTSAPMAEQDGAVPIAALPIELAPPAHGIQLHYGPADSDAPDSAYVLAPGDETVRCEVVVDSHPAYHVAAYETSERAGMHHLSLFTGTTGAVSPGDTCMLATTPLFLVQTRHERTEIAHGAPELAGAALTVNAGSFVIQAHAINTTEEPMVVEAWINLETVDSTPVPVTWLSLSAGHTMAIAPHTKATLSATATDMNPGPVLQLVGHQHAHGTEQRAMFRGREVYRNTNWAEPKVQWFSSVDAAPFTVPAKGTLSWECDIDNTTDSTLRFANEVNTAEMCNLVGFVLGAKPFAQSLP